MWKNTLYLGPSSFLLWSKSQCIKSGNTVNEGWMLGAKNVQKMAKGKNMWGTKILGKPPREAGEIQISH